MIRKLFAGILALAILVAGAIVGPRLLNSPLQGAVTGQMIANGQADADRQRRDAAVQAAIREQQQAQERTAAAARQAEQHRLRQETEQKLALKQEEDRLLADAFVVGGDRQQHTEAAGLKLAEAHADEQDRQQREAAQALARKHLHDEQRVIAEARAKAEGVQLALKGSGPSTQATGSVKTTCESCAPSANGRRTGTKGRRGRNVAQAQHRRVRPVRTESVGCPVLAWLRIGY
jgi:hypothetical protein